jgi:hypothetical protein
VSPILGIWASQNYSRYSLPTSYESIATTTVGSGGSSTITFSSIPSTYTHLQLRIIAKSTASGSYSQIRFNSDSGSNYAMHELYGTGSSALAYAETSQTYLNQYYTIETSTASNVFSASIFDILDYANTNKYKTTRKLSGNENNSAGGIDLASGLWRSTSAIDAITITPNSGNFAQYSSFALYGIKGA